MLCKVCGNEIPAGQRFCGSCGTMLSTVQENGAQKQELLNKLEAVDKVCKNCGDRLDHIQQLKNELELLKRGILSHQIKDGFRRGMKLQFSKKELIQIPVVIVVVAVLDMLLAQSGDAANFMIIPIALAVAVVASIFRKRQQEQLKDQIASVEQSIETENEVLSKYVQENEPVLSVIPDDYWYPLCTEYLVRMVRTDRAATIPEALNMFDLQLHRWKVEESNAQMLAMQQEQISRLDNMRTLLAITSATVAYNTLR